jgi:hypothetical protein
MDRTWLPVKSFDWRLNERHYGALQGLNKADTAAKEYGDEQVLIWRRSYDTPPPALEADDRAASATTRATPSCRAQIPLTECLKDTVARVLPCWNEVLAPAIKSGQRIVDRRARQLDPRAGEVPRQHRRRRHRRRQHPERHPAGLRTRRDLKPIKQLLPGRPGSDCQGPGAPCAVELRLLSLCTAWAGVCSYTCPSPSL